ncbi:hypothetical protein FA10DRAFT_120314 [Acaromyces ingoldii]|uniref:Uncharacterized protein n=1 Tax=Acaromyces ingoldii TaxID=215250 RepID=A0A316YPB6_9BASI|nr:hypothetical protein FA10DRAFT_120314 [Acaromyces ingoldii]PWN90644.1 hypothetical protein FA10DRAFT_120314 [Acaromyces ingoldii]
MPGMDKETERLLMRFYPRVSSLADYLCQLLPQSEGHACVEELFQSPESSCSSNLSSSLACLRGALVGHSEIAQQPLYRTWRRPREEEALALGDVAQIVEQAQLRLFQQERGRQGRKTTSAANILTHGYRRADERASVFKLPLVSGSSALTNFYVNTNVTRIVMGPEWRRMLLL